MRDIMTSMMVKVTPSRADEAAYPPRKGSSERKRNKLAKMIFKIPKREKSAGSTSETELCSDWEEDKKLVRFKEDPSTHLVMPRYSYMSEEMRAVWFQSEEFRKIQHDCLKQIRKIDRGETLKDKKYCARGLEGHSRLGNITKKLNRRPAVRAVLESQEDDHGDEEIARRYQQTTSSCQLWATTVGLKDQHAAEEGSSFLM